MLQPSYTLSRKFLLDRDSTTCLTDFFAFHSGSRFAFQSGLKDFGDFVASVFQASAVER